MANETNLLPGENLATEDDALGTGGSETRQFVTFISGNEVFAVDMAPVQEIIRVPAMVRVPLAPPALEGLANLRGKVLPIVSLRRIFGFEERAHDDSSRAVVIDMGQPLGFVVDKVSSVLGVEPAQIESVGGLRATVNTDLLAGLIKNVGGTVSLEGWLLMKSGPSMDSTLRIAVRETVCPPALETTQE